MSSNVFVAEFLRYQRLANGALQQVDDGGFREPLADGGNSIAVVVGHLAGNLRSRFTDFLTTDGEKPWRNRDAEFEDPGLSRAQIMERWHAAWEMMLDQVGELDREDLERSVTIRDQSLTVGAALARASCHIAYHVGQIVTLAQRQVGPAWVSLSIPRGTSDEYNRNPTLE